MIIPPNTPPIPISIHIQSFNANLVTKRVQLASSSSANTNDLVRLIINIEDYINLVFEFIDNKLDNRRDLQEALSFAAGYVLVENCIPWTNLQLNRPNRPQSDGIESSLKKLSMRKSSSVDFPVWHLINEIEISLISLSLSYNKLAGSIINELIGLEQNLTAEIDARWKSVTQHYKKALSCLSFVSSNTQFTGSSLNPVMVEVFKKIITCSLQLSILSKSLWMIRTDQTKNSTNGMLTRLSIYILEEISNCQNIIANFSLDSTYINYDISDWSEYLKLIKNYINGYAGMFLSIEHYEKDELGHAIGLVNFSLLNLQGKKFGEADSANSSTSSKDKLKKLNFTKKISQKITTNNHENIINNIQSVSTLNINKSAFKKSTDLIILTDLTYLFDELIKLNGKYRKENNNLKFDTVVNWMDVNKDSKWPTGLKLPITQPDWEPIVYKSHNTVDSDSYAGRGSYY